MIGAMQATGIGSQDAGRRRSIHGWLGRSLALIAVVVHVSVSSPVRADEGPPESPPPSTADVVFDALVLRPTGLAVALVGITLFLPAAVLASPGGMHPIEEARDYFVRTPADFLTARPLGEF